MSDIPTVSGPDYPMGEGSSDLPIIKGYKILKQLGEGGMGIVYLAEQTEPIRRQIALKVVKPGMDSKQVIARFEAERQALAMLDHPNIAHVYDAGTTEKGRPYFVMEYINGTPITDYCDQQELSIEERLELFKEVCEGIQHAHQRGIIHRDIKPSNVLIIAEDGKATPKVIDFGIAKAIKQELTERTMFTTHGQLIGTPEYMSPEQADLKKDIDTRTDIYSLGIVLYELLAGVLPFEPQVLREGGYAEIQRIIREQEPPRPSTKLSSLGKNATKVAKRRQTQLSTLVKSLHRELEWIPLMAIRKERDQRYKTVSDLAEDVRNYLVGNPLMAGPESTTYKFRKFVKRRKVLVTAVGSILVVVLLGFIISLVMYKQASTSYNIVEGLAKKKYPDLFDKAILELQVGSASEAEERLGLIKVGPFSEERGWEYDYLCHLIGEEIMTMEETRSFVDFAYSSDGKYTAFVNLQEGEAPLSIEIIDTYTGNIVQSISIMEPGCSYPKELLTHLPARLDNHPFSNIPIVLSHDNKRITSCYFEYHDCDLVRYYHDNDPYVCVWDIETGNILWKGYGEPICFSPDDKYIAKMRRGRYSNAINIVDISSRLNVFYLSQEHVFSFCFSPDGKKIAYATDNEVTISDLNNTEAKLTLDGQELWRFPDQNAPTSLSHFHNFANLISFSPDGKKIASGSRNGIKIWNAENGKELLTVGESRPWASPNDYPIAFSPDSRWIASLDDKAVKIWDAEKGHELMRFPTDVTSISYLSFSKDRDNIISGTRDGKLRKWQTDTIFEVIDLQKSAQISAAVFSPDLKLFACQPYNQNEPPLLHIWDIETETEIVAFETPRVSSLAFSFDGQWIASGGCPDDKVSIWDINTGKEVMNFDNKTNPSTFFDGRESIAFSPNGNLLASGFPDGTVKIWDLRNKVELEKFTITTCNGGVGLNPVVDFSLDGKKIAVAWHGHSGGVETFDLKCGIQVLSFQDKATGRCFSDLCFSPDGQYIGISGIRGFGIWDVKSGKWHVQYPNWRPENDRKKRHVDGITSIAMTFDNKRVVLSNPETLVELWSLESHRKLLSLPCNITKQNRHSLWGCWSLIAVSSDGRNIASFNNDTVRVFKTNPRKVPTTHKTINTQALKRQLNKADDSNSTRKKILLTISDRISGSFFSKAGFLFTDFCCILLLFIFIRQAALMKTWGFWAYILPVFVIGLLLRKITLNFVFNNIPNNVLGVLLKPDFFIIYVVLPSLSLLLLHILMSKCVFHFNNSQAIISGLFMTLYINFFTYFLFISFTAVYLPLLVVMLIVLLVFNEINLIKWYRFWGFVAILTIGFLVFCLFKGFVDASVSLYFQKPIDTLWPRPRLGLVTTSFFLYSVIISKIFLRINLLKAFIVGLVLIGVFVMFFESLSVLGF